MLLLTSFQVVGSMKEGRRSECRRRPHALKVSYPFPINLAKLGKLGSYEGKEGCLEFLNDLLLYFNFAPLVCSSVTKR